MDCGSTMKSIQASIIFRSFLSRAKDLGQTKKKLTHRKGSSLLVDSQNMKTRLPAQPSNSEWLTRKGLIDSMLGASGWKVVPFDQGKSLGAQHRCAIEEYPTAAGPADYALSADGRILGIVEAKKLTLGPQNVLSQAERYSKGLEQLAPRFGDYGVPFLIRPMAK